MRYEHFEPEATLPVSIPMNNLTQATVQHEISSNRPVRVNISRPTTKQTRRYLRKNTESNVSNQAFSFVTTKRKSWSTLMNILKSQPENGVKTGKAFFSYMKLLKRSCRGKYMNRQTLSMLCNDSSSQILTELTGSPVYNNFELPLRLFCKLTRTMLRAFLSDICVLTVITSKKILKETQVEHLGRRREILNFLTSEAHRKHPLY